MMMASATSKKVMTAKKANNPLVATGNWGGNGSNVASVSLPRLVFGKCSAMGDECGNSRLQNNRHFCKDCGDGVQAIFPCSREKGKDGNLVCMNCYNENPPKADQEILPNVGACPAMGYHCPIPHLGWGEITCGSCLYPVHRNPRCMVFDKTSGEYVCKGCTYMLNAPKENKRKKNGTNKENETKKNEESVGLGVIETQSSPDSMLDGSPEDSKMPPLGQPSQLSRTGNTQQASRLGSGTRLFDHADNDDDEDSCVYEIEKDEEDEESGDETGDKPKRSRSKNYSSEEDFLLTKAWCGVSADSRNGVGQKIDVFKQKLKDSMHTLVKQHNKGVDGNDPNRISILRSKKSIMYRWSNHIKPKCTKWASVCKNVKKKSGMDIDTLTEKRQDFYKHSHGKGKQFPFLECYGLLEDLPKWMEKDESADRAGSKKRKKKKKGKDKGDRTVGKRQKALNDKILKINQQMGNEGGATFTASGTGSATANAISMFTQQLSGMATHFSVNDWSEENRSAYFNQQAQLQILEQKKRMLLLQRELQDLEKTSHGGGSGDDDDEDEFDEEPIPASDDDED